MSMPTCDQITQAANLAAELAADLGGLATLVCMGDPWDYPTEEVYASKTLALTNACLIVFNMQVDLACYPLTASTVLLLDIDA